MYEPEILHKVRALANKNAAELDEDTFYRSYQVKNYLENLAATMLKQTEKMYVNIFADTSENAMIGGTNRNIIVMNYKSHFVIRYVTPEGRWIAFMGLFYHEMAHCLYLDFDTQRTAMAALQSGKMYGLTPIPATPEETASLKELEAAIRSKTFRPVIGTIYHKIENSLVDRHDEDCIVSRYGGMCEAGIMKMRESLFSTTPLHEAAEEAVQEGKLSKLSAFFNTLLTYSRFGRVPMTDESLWQTSEILKAIASVDAEITTAATTHDANERWNCLNKIVLTAWPFIRESLNDENDQAMIGAGQQSSESGEQQAGSGGSGGENQGQSGQGSGQGQQQGSDSSNEGGQQNNSSGNSGASGKQGAQGQSQSGSGSSGGSQKKQKGGSNGSIKLKLTDENARKVLADILSAAEKLGQMEEPSGRQTRPEAKKENAPAKREDSGKSNDSADSPKQGEYPKDQSKNEAMLKAVLEQVQKQIARETAEEAVEKELASELNAEIMAVNQNSGHKGIPIHAYKVTSENEERYNSIISEVKPYSKRLQRAIEDALKNIKLGSLQKHRPYGKILCVQDTYRPDGLCYAKKKLPQDRPDMAVSLLIDNSGSMYGPRIEAARKAAVLLYDFASALDIPVFVAGHEAGSNGVTYRAFADFRSVGKKDRYRICSMGTGGCNRDGAAIEISANLLSKRQEDIKLLIIISDGQPNHSNYGGTEAQKDIQSIIRRYKAQGIETIAAGIGDDRKRIHAIYGDCYLDISDLNSLPRQLTNLVRKRILESIR